MEMDQYTIITIKTFAVNYRHFLWNSLIKFINKLNYLTDGGVVFFFAVVQMVRNTKTTQIDWYQYFQECDLLSVEEIPK